MIVRALGGKLLPWVAGGTGALLLAMVVATWALHSRNSGLNERLGALEQRNGQLQTALQQQATENTLLAEEIGRRDRLVSEALEARRRSERQAREQINALHLALEDDECAQRPHPAAVGDILRQRSDHRDSDPVRVPAR